MKMDPNPLASGAAYHAERPVLPIWGSTEQVAIEDLIGRRLPGCLLDGIARLLGWLAAVEQVQARHGARMRTAAMARVAGDNLAAGEVGLVNGIDHQHHLAGHLLQRLVVGISRPLAGASLDVAIAPVTTCP